MQPKVMSRDDIEFESVQKSCAIEKDISVLAALVGSCSPSSCIGFLLQGRFQNDFTLSAIDILVAAGADIHIRLSSGMFPLELAMLYQDPEIVSHLLKLEGKIQQYEIHPSVLCVQTNQPASIFEQITSQYGLANSNPETSPFIILAARKRNLAIVQKILDMDPASINGVESETGCTALHIGCLQGDVELVSFLIHRGADIESRDSFGQTPLFGAIQAQNMQVVNKLLDSKCNGDVFRNNDQSCIEIAEGISMDLYKENGSYKTSEEILSALFEIVPRIQGSGFEDFDWGPLDYVNEKCSDIYFEAVKHVHPCFSKGVMYSTWCEASEKYELEKSNLEMVVETKSD